MDIILTIVIILILLAPVIAILNILIFIVRNIKNTKRIITTCPERKFEFLDVYRIKEYHDGQEHYFILIKDVENAKLYVLSTQYCKNFRFTCFLNNYNIYKIVDNQKISLTHGDIGKYWLEKEMPEKDLSKLRSLSGTKLPGNAVLISARAVLGD